MPSRRSRNLVVVRCGDNSLHTHWLEGDRRWELAVSYFGGDESRQFADASYVHRYRGGKWDGLFDFFSRTPELLDLYDYVWLPDDDIAATSQSIDRMFDCMKEFDLELAQPSLSSESYLSHLVSAWNPLFKVRNVNLVEIMVPVVRTDVLRELLPMFENAKTGFGIDFVWQRFTSDPLTKVAVIDAVQVTHTRPVGGALHQMIAQEGAVSAGEEQARFLQPFSHVVKTEMIIGGWIRSGSRVGSRRLAASIAAFGWCLRPAGRRGFQTTLSPTRFQRWVLRNWWNSIREESAHLALREKANEN